MKKSPLIVDAERRLIAQAGMPFPIVEQPPFNVGRIYENGTPFSKRVPLSLLIATQRDLDAGNVQAMMADSDSLAPIQTVCHHGRHFINDGHHRAVAARYRGETTIPAQVVEV